MYEINFGLDQSIITTIITCVTVDGDARLPLLCVISWFTVSGQAGVKAQEGSCEDQRESQITSNREWKGLQVSFKMIHSAVLSNAVQCNVKQGSTVQC